MFVVVKAVKGRFPALTMYLAGRCGTGPFWTKRLKRAVTFGSIEDAREAAKAAGGAPIRVETPVNVWRERDEE